eukprot:762521-Hanusia_phi.AAC.28
MRSLLCLVNVVTSPARLFSCCLPSSFLLLSCPCPLAQQSTCNMTRWCAETLDPSQLESNQENFVSIRRRYSWSFLRSDLIGQVTSLNPLRSYIFEDANVALARAEFSAANEEAHRTSEVEGDVKMVNLPTDVEGAQERLGLLERVWVSGSGSRSRGEVVILQTQVEDLEKKIEERIAIAILSACSLHSSPVDCFSCQALQAFGCAYLDRLVPLSVGCQGKLRPPLLSSPLLTSPLPLPSSPPPLPSLVSSAAMTLSLLFLQIDPSPNLNVRSISKPPEKQLQTAFRKLLSVKEEKKTTSWLTRFNTIRLFSRMRQTGHIASLPPDSL